MASGRFTAGAASRPGGGRVLRQLVVLYTGGQASGVEASRE